MGAVLSHMRTDPAGESPANQDQDPTGKLYLIRLFLGSSAFFLLLMALVMFDQERMQATPIGVLGSSFLLASYAIDPHPLMRNSAAQPAVEMKDPGPWSRGFLVLGAAMLITSFILKMVD